MSLLLTREECNRFADWLEQEMQSDKGMAEQARKLGPVGEVMAKRLETHAVACFVILKGLRKTEEIIL